MDVGIIGYRGHARRLIDKLDARDDVRLRYIYHPTKDVLDRRGTNDIKKLTKLDGVIVASPTATHGKYVKALRLVHGYKGYIFCEKPPFDQQGDVDYFRLERDERLYFNFNFRHSRLAKSLDNSGHIGKLIHVDVRLTHGLAYKDGYPSSWRADPELHPIGPLETVACHWIDLLFMNFGCAIDDFHVTLSNVAQAGEAPDTGHIVMRHPGGATSSVFVSYAAPKVFSFSLIGTLGSLHCDGNRLVVRSPRDSFDKSGMFVEPPVVHSVDVDFEHDYERTLDLALNEFLLHVYLGTIVDPRGYSVALKTNQVLLDIKEKKLRQGV